VDTVAAMLGVLHAGAAVVPIDPAYPALRVAAMLETCRPSLVLADERLIEWSVLEPWARASVRDVGADEPVDASPPGSSVALPIDRAAYLIFTSGSTGRPRGVLVQHSGLWNMVEQQIDAFGIDRTSRILQYASLSFDASISEVFTALCAGATLCLVERAVDRQGIALLELLERRRISVVTLPPSLLRVLPPRELPDLTTLVSAGEACSDEVVRRWWRSGRRLLNAYGPSEVTVCATMKRLAGPDDSPTIGTALRGIHTHVLGGALLPLPDGERGELYLGGVGLARGYCGDPARTAERFVPDPVSGKPGARLYRTGDLVKRGAELEFVGRSDDQIKLRGFRVEPGEVTAVLRRAPGVTDALVLAHDRTTGGPVLVAHVVGDAAAEPRIKAFARRRLPRFLQPASYRFLDAWPLTTNGKVDRAELMRRASDGRACAGEAIGERGGVARVARLFQELLEIEHVDAERSFFDLGGDSILAIRLLLRIEAEFGCRLGLGALFENPSAAALASRLERARASARPAARCAPDPLELRSGGARRPLWLVAPVHGNALCYLELADRLPPGRSLFGLQAPGLEVDEGEPCAEFAALARHQVARIRRRQPVGPYLLAGWSLGGTLAFEMALELQRQGEQVPLLLLVASVAPSVEHVAAAREELADYAAWRICYMFGRALALSHGAQVDMDLEEFRGMPPQAAYRLFARCLRGVGPVSDDTSIDEIARWVQVYRSTLRGFHLYAPGSRYRGRVLVLKPRGANPFLRDRFVTRYVKADDWSDFVDGAIDVETVGGHHYALMSPPWVDEVADRMADWLEARDR
jgi:amino acid adenylation domain-containing protein